MYKNEKDTTSLYYYAFVLDYYLNEIEEGGLAGTYTNFKQITYPIIDILADAYVRKAVELLK